MTIADTLMNSAVANADSMRTGAQTELGLAIQKLGYPMTIGYGSMTVNQIDSDFTLGAVPVYDGAHYIAPQMTFGEVPTMDPVPGMEVGSAPTLTATQPSFVEPLRPSQLPEFTGTAPSVTDITVPAAPDALYGMNLVPPTLSDITVPPAPSVVLPEFAATAPDTNIAAPTDFSAVFAQNYSNASVSMRAALESEVDAQLLKINPEYHNQMAALEARLTTYMAGGTALPVAVEQAIFNRARDKTNGEYLQARDGIWAEGAKRGFTIPGGAQYSALNQARQAAADNNARAAMDVSLKQAELEQNNIQFAMTQSAELRKAVMGALNAWFGNLIQLNGQGLEYARDLLQASIALYDTMVKIATARIEIYKAEAQVYEIRLKAVMAVYDVYQAEIRALEAQVNVDRARVDAFTAQAGAYGALANAYRAVIEGVVAKAQLEKIKADIFGEQVRAFSAQVGAKQAEWQGFTAQVQGEVAKQGAFETQVRAYGEQVRARATEIQGYEAQVRAITAKNEGAYRTYGAAVQAFTALIGGQSEAVKADVTAFEGQVRSYIASATAEEARVKAKIAGYQATVSNQIGLYNTNAQIAIASAHGYNTYMTQAANVAVGAAQVYSNMASSAMSGINALGANIYNQTA